MARYTCKACGYRWESEFVPFSCPQCKQSEYIELPELPEIPELPDIPVIPDDPDIPDIPSVEFDDGKIMTVEEFTQLFQACVPSNTIDKGRLTLALLGTSYNISERCPAKTRAITDSGMTNFWQYITNSTSSAVTYLGPPISYTAFTSNLTTNKLFTFSEIEDVREHYNQCVVGGRNSINLSISGSSTLSINYTCNVSVKLYSSGVFEIWNSGNVEMTSGVANTTISSFQNPTKLMYAPQSLLVSVNTTGLTKMANLNVYLYDSSNNLIGSGSSMTTTGSTSLSTVPGTSIDITKSKQLANLSKIGISLSMTGTTTPIVPPSNTTVSINFARSTPYISFYDGNSLGIGIGAWRPYSGTTLRVLDEDLSYQLGSIAGCSFTGGSPNYTLTMPASGWANFRGGDYVLEVPLISSENGKTIYILMNVYSDGNSTNFRLEDHETLLVLSRNPSSSVNKFLIRNQSSSGYHSIENGCNFGNINSRGDEATLSNGGQYYLTQCFSGSKAISQKLYFNTSPTLSLREQNNNTNMGSAVGWKNLLLYRTLSNWSSIVSMVNSGSLSWTLY